MISGKTLLKCRMLSRLMVHLVTVKGKSASTAAYVFRDYLSSNANVNRYLEENDVKQVLNYFWWNGFWMKNNIWRIYLLSTALTAAPHLLTKEAPVHFDGHTLLEYPNMITKRYWLSFAIRNFGFFGKDNHVIFLPRSMESQERNLYKFRVKTTSPGGLILWQSRGQNIRGDYFSIAIVDGHVEMSYDLGKEQDIFIIQSVILVNDGKWHTVTAERWAPK